MDEIGLAFRLGLGLRIVPQGQTLGGVDEIEGERGIPDRGLGADRVRLSKDRDMGEVGLPVCLAVDPCADALNAALAWLPAGLDQEVIPV